MTEQEQTALDTFLKEIRDVSWFAHCGEPDQEAVVVSNLVDAWDGWNEAMLTVWLPETHGLEKVAVDRLGEEGVDAIFSTVSQAVSEPFRMGMARYFERHSTESGIARANVDLGLWPEWLEATKRDLCWAAIEVVVGRHGFFTCLLKYYRAGRWACAWEEGSRSRRVVLL